MPKTSTPEIYQTDFSYRLEPQTCCICGVLFAMEAGYDLRRQRDHSTFWCPNGHPQHYTGPSDEERARDEAIAQRDAARSLAAREADRRRLAENNAEFERRSAAALKGWNTRIKNRIANGVCPCCRRSFPNVKDHMATKHPGYKVPGATE